MNAQKERLGIWFPGTRRITKVSSLTEARNVADQVYDQQKHCFRTAFVWDTNTNEVIYAACGRTLAPREAALWLEKLAIKYATARHLLGMTVRSILVPLGHTMTMQDCRHMGTGPIAW